MQNDTSRNHQRLTQAEKDKNNKAWYRDQANYRDRQAFNTMWGWGPGNTGEYGRMRINYDLVNNKIDPKDFYYVTNPWGDEVGELPAQLTNRDITSSKIKAVMGIEARRPFNWKVVAVNEEATTRKEQEEFGRMKQFVVSQIMTPIEQEIATQFLQGKTQEEVQQAQQQIAEQLKASTPEEVKKYMRREHQDPAEILASQILTYLSQKLELNDIFLKGVKHAAIAGREIYYVGVSNGEPAIVPVNPMYFDFDKSPDIDFIEDGEWACAEYRMTPSEVITEYGEELTNEEIDLVFQQYGNSATTSFDTFLYDTTNSDLVRVLHIVWKSLRKIGFLTFFDGKDLQEKIVNENYSLDEAGGDISIRWEWIPEVHEATKIGRDTYVRMRPVPNQFKDLDNLYECKLPYIGAVYDNDNSESTSLVDRIRPYQYLYDIIWYRAELLMAQDKGKKVLFDIGSIPRSNGITLKTHEYYLDANSYGYLNPREEGNRGDMQITNLVKEIDLSNTSDITKYVELAEYVERRAGDAVGITKQLEGAIQEREAVQNVQRAISLSTNILEEFFQKHDRVKQRVLQSLIECAKVAYTINKPKKLSYVLDDMSNALLEIDQELLDNSTYGIFVTNSGQSAETKEMITTLAQAALQNQMVNLSTVVKVLQADSIQEAEETLLMGELGKREELMAQQEAAAKQQMQLEQMKVQHEREKWRHEREMLELEESLKKDRELAKQAILALGFVGGQDQEGDVKAGNIIMLLDKMLEAKKLKTEQFKAESDVELKTKELAVKSKVKK